ncbi:MAG: hypothetical protein WBA57_04960 [Elainellaceae cyanobacterium]
MSTEPNTPETPTPVEVNPDTDQIVESGNFSDSETMRQETQALVDAIRMRAQMDAESAGNFTRETYLNAIRQLRETVEKNKLFDPEQIEQSFESVQQEAEKNWQSIQQETEKNVQSVVKDVTEFGDRLSEAAQVAWDIITQSRQGDDSSK